MGLDNSIFMKESGRRRALKREKNARDKELLLHHRYFIIVMINIITLT